MRPFQVSWIEDACGPWRWRCPISSYTCRLTLRWKGLGWRFEAHQHRDYSWRFMHSWVEPCRLWGMQINRGKKCNPPEHQDLRNSRRESTQRSPRKKSRTSNNESKERAVSQKPKKMGRVSRSLTSKSSQSSSTIQSWSGSTDFSILVARYLWAALARAFE